MSQSDLVAAAVEEAARDAIADGGGMVTGFIALVTYIDTTGNRCWSMAAGEEQGLAQSLGMADILEMTVRAQVEAAFFASSEEDE